MIRFVSLLLIALLAFNLGLSSWADGDPSSPNKVILLIDNGLEENYKVIHEQASSLSGADKFMVYNSRRKDALVPFIVNFILGLGIGSFIAGDYFGGLLELIGELGGFALVLVGGGISSASFNQAVASGNSASSASPLGGAIAVSGILAIIAARVFGIVRPFTFTGDYNKMLQGALRMAESNISLLPYSKEEQDMYGFSNQETGLVLSIQY